MERGILTRFQPSPGELVAHSPEWATGSHLFRAFAQFLPLPRELVVHSPEWATGSQFFGLLSLFRPSPWELVVYSPEWSTGSHIFLASCLVSPLSTQKARARPGLSQFLKLLEAVLALGQTLLGRFLA